MVNNNYINIRQNQATNLMARFNNKRKTCYCGTTNAKYGNADVTITFADETIKYSVITAKLQRYLYALISKEGCNTNVITIHVNDLLQAISMKTSRKSKELLRNNLRILQQTNISYTINKSYTPRTKNGKPQEKKVITTTGSFDMISTWKNTSGVLTIEVPEVLIEYMKEWKTFSYPVSIFKLPANKDYYFAIADYIAERQRGKNKEITISVRSLYEVCKLAGMIAYEDKPKNFHRDIVEQLENALTGCGFDWKYEADKEYMDWAYWINNRIIILPQVHLKC